jgi:hypothetical protein
MNWKGCGRKRSYLVQRLPGGTRKTTKIFSLDGLPHKNRNQDLLNRYRSADRYIAMFGKFLFPLYVPIAE